MKNHNYHMRQCIVLGKEAMQKGNPPVGAIVVKGDKVIGTGIEAGKSSKDITKHAEIEAIKDALSAQLIDLKGCTLYTTHEPCIMCSYVLRHYHVEDIVYGTSVDHVGGISSEFKVMQTQKVPKWGKPPKIIEGVLHEECLALSEEYIKQKNHG